MKVFYVGFHRFLKRRFHRFLVSLEENVRCFLDNENLCCGSVCVGIVTLVFVLVVWLVVRDPCQQKAITDSLCQKYHEGSVAGRWCYDICVDQSIRLSRCLQQEEEVTTFFWKKAVIKVTGYHGDHLTADPDVPSPFNAVLKEGLTISAFRRLILGYLNRKLGQVNHTVLCGQIIEFADFNDDGKLSLGEASSVWQLLQIHEFFLLFVFQASYAFPVLNGTCGSLYAFEYVGVHGLYRDTELGLINKIFSNSYRWSLPHWPKRANIAIGLLEYSAAIFEEANARFYMCEFSPLNFGHTEKYELKVVDMKNVVSEAMLRSEMRARNCLIDADCSYGNSCITVCDRNSQRCTSDLKQPFLVGICEILKKYLLHDAPKKMKTELSLLLSKCVHLKSTNLDMGRETELDADKENMDVISHHVIKHNLVLNELKLLLWKEIKDVAIL